MQSEALQFELIHATIAELFEVRPELIVEWGIRSIACDMSVIESSPSARTKAGSRSAVCAISRSRTAGSVLIISFSPAIRVVVQAAVGVGAPFLDAFAQTPKKIIAKKSFTSGASQWERSCRSMSR